MYAYMRHDDEQTLLMLHNLNDQPTTDYGLTLRASPLEPGTYRARDLVADAKGAELVVGDKGAFKDYRPFPTLQPNQSVILILE